MRCVLKVAKSKDTVAMLPELSHWKMVNEMENDIVTCACKCTFKKRRQSVSQSVRDCNKTISPLLLY